MKEIVQDGAPILRETAHPVPEVLFGTSELTELIADMSEALDRFPEGVALAAPQVGVSYRIFVVRKDRTLPPSDHEESATAPAPEIEVYINPEIVKSSRKRAKVDEGCLSVHGIYGTTKRHEQVTITARRPDGSKVQRGASGLLAQIFQHEIDHLDGILFIDHAEHLLHIGHESAFRFAYFGTPKVSSETLELLIERGFVPSVVVTSPDAPRGRGLALTPSPTKNLAVAHGIPVLTPEKLDVEAMAAINAHAYEYAVVVAYGKIFPEPLIRTFPKGVLNVHYSLLPKYRGATPLESALLAGEKETGVTIQKMVKELDAGDILAQEATEIVPEETVRELRARLITLGAELLAETLPTYLNGNSTHTPQEIARATHTHKIKKEDGLLSLDAPAEVNWNKYRAYADSIGTYFFQNGKRIKIVAASYKNGTFSIKRVIPEGKKEMAYADFARKN